jgi:hypothetical protein
VVGFEFSRDTDCPDFFVIITVRAGKFRDLT